MEKTKMELPEIVVSLTSFPERIGLLRKTLDSICNQTLKADRIVLWLAESQFPNKEKDLPGFFSEYYKHNFEVRWCDEDIRPHKKYYYAFKAFPEALIVTVDDDLEYDEDMLTYLVDSWKVYPDAVSAMRVHLMMPDKRGKIDIYQKWLYEFSGVIGVPSMQLFSTSGAGTLYPPGCMDEEVFNIENIKKYCLNADDIWLKVMQVKKGTPVVLVKNHTILTKVDDTQKFALSKKNVHKGANDTQLGNLLNIYNENSQFEKLIFQDNFNEKTYINKYSLIRQNSLKCDVMYIKQLEKDIEAYIKLNELQKADIRYLAQRVGKFKKFAVDNKQRAQKVAHSIKNYGLFYTIKMIIEKIN